MKMDHGIYITSFIKPVISKLKRIRLITEIGWVGKDRIAARELNLY